MSATAQKRSVPPPVPPHVLHRSLGAVIEASRHRPTLPPPPNPHGLTDGVPALSELVEQIVEDSSAVERDSEVGGLTPSFTFDSRDNTFTTTHGSYLEATAGLFSSAFGGDDEFQRVRMIGMQYVPLTSKLYLGLRGEAAASFDDAPFYLRPFINLRGAPVMQYQGEEMAQVEAEVRWQFWKRLSVVGFVGGGVAWNDFERLDATQSIVTGGTGLRYELARKYGIHAGLDVAFGPDDPAVYIQIGSAWSRP